MIEQSKKPMTQEEAGAEARRIFGGNAHVRIVNGTNKVIALRDEHGFVPIPLNKISKPGKEVRTWEEAFHRVLTIVNRSPCPVCGVTVNVFGGLMPGATAAELRSGATLEGHICGVPERHTAPCGFVCSCGGPSRRDFQKKRVHTSEKCLKCGGGDHASTAGVDVSRRPQ